MLSLSAQQISARSLPPDFTITCHAGALNTRPSTLESVRKCVEAGAMVVEFDVSFRPDSTPVIIHSSSPRADEGASFEEALIIVRQSSKCMMNLDLKSYSNVAEIDALLQKYELFGRAFYTGVGEKSCETVRKSSAVPYYLNCSSLPKNDEAALAKAAEKIKALGAVGLNTHYRNISKAVVKVMHENSLPVSGWTADSILTMKKLIRLGVDNITTRKPDKLIGLFN